MSGVVGSLIGIYVLVYALLNLPMSRSYLTAVAARSLSDFLKTEVSIGDLEVGLFNRLTLHDVRLTDQSGKPMLVGKLISAKVSLTSLMNGKVSLPTISLLDTDIRLYRESDEKPANFQFLIDAFKSEKKTPSAPIDLRVNSLIVRRSRISWDRRDKVRKRTGLDLNHIDVSGLDMNVSLKALKRDSINLRIRNFQLHERSGLHVDKLTLRMAANRKRCEIKDFRLDLPNSHIEQENLSLSYDLAHFFRSLQVQGRLRRSYLSLPDVAALNPTSLSVPDMAVDLSGRFLLRPSRWQFSDIRIDSRDKRLRLLSDITLHRTQPERIEAELKRLHADSSLVRHIYNGITRKTLPAPLQALGNVDLTGHATFVRPSRLRFNGLLRTDAGQLTARGTCAGETFDIAASSEGVDVGRILSAKEQLGIAAFDVALHGKRQGDITARGTIRRVAFRQHDYQNIDFDGRWDGKALQAHLTADDPDLRLRAEASMPLPRPLEALRLKANVAACAPNALGWTSRYAGTRFSGTLEADLRSGRADEPTGRLSLTDFCMEAPDSTYRLNRLVVTSGREGKHNFLDLDSDFARARYTSDFSLSKCAARFGRLLDPFLPGLSAASADRPQTDGTASLSLHVDDTEFFKQVLGIPLSLHGPLDAQGYIAGGDRLSLTARTGGIDYDGTRIDDVKIHARSDGNELRALLQATKPMANSNIRTAVELTAADNRLGADLTWTDDRGGRYRGDLHLKADFNHYATRHREIDISLLPGNVYINDSLWNVGRGHLNWNDRSLRIEDFRLSHRDQWLSLDGLLQPGTQDSLTARLNRIDVAYIMDLINFHAVDFAGEATGSVSLSNSLRQPHIDAELSIGRFLFNDAPMGRLYVQGLWDNDEKQIGLRATMVEDTHSQTYINGYISPRKKGLDLSFRTVNTNLGFIDRYLAGIFSGVDGRATGRLRLFGPFKQLDLEGRQSVRMQCHVDATGADYTLESDSVVISPGRFDLRAVRLTDKAGHHGLANGYLAHDHLHDLSYRFDIRADRLLAYDRPKELDMPFFATARTTGTMHLEGRPGQFQADMDLRPDEGTTFTYIMDRPETSNSNGLLTFNDRSRRPAAADTLPRPVPAPTAGTTDIRLNFLLDITPEARMRVLMDEHTGDAIDVRGDGVVRASYYNKDGFQLFGSYNVSQGTYKLSIQDIIRKDFTIQPGSSITFTGDPARSTLDLQAVYTVNSASLSDLNIGNNFSNNTVRVNCLLNVEGNVDAPQLNFDLDLPTVNEDEKQMVRNIISTEEDMNMQIIYLLSVGRFYTYDYGNTATASTQSQSSVAMKSFLSNTLSGQLNNIISNAIGSSNWSFGTNLSTGSVGWSDMEVEGLLSGRLLNNRLLINGNFGYRDRPTYSNNFVGDFDIQWLLTPRGTVSLKAYSETNDRYFTKSTLTTQGIGLILKRDFTRFSDLFRFWKPKKKKEQ